MEGIQENCFKFIRTSTQTVGPYLGPLAPILDPIEREPNFILIPFILLVIYFCLKILIWILKRIFQAMTKTRVRSSKLEKAKGLIKSIHSEIRASGGGVVHTLPSKGMKNTHIQKKLETKREADTWKNEKISSLRYDNHNKTKSNLLSSAHSMFYQAHSLNESLFPSVCQMERDIIKMMLKAFHAKEGSYGVLTSGNNENFLLTLSIYKYYFKGNNNICKPNVYVFCLVIDF
jgi:hypothetical protein